MTKIQSSIVCISLAFFSQAGLSSDVFSTEKYFLLNSNYGAAPLEVMSLENNNHIQLGVNELVLNKYQSATVTDTSTLQGTVVTGTGSFTLGSEANATDLPVPASFAGTQFAIPHQRGAHTYYLYSLHGVANVQVQVGVATPIDLVLQPGVVTPFSAGADTLVTGRITADAPILVSHKTLLNSGEDGDAYPVPPVNTELWGISSLFNNYAAMEDNTTVTLEDSNGNSQTFTIPLAGNFYKLLANPEQPQGQGAGLHITADKPIAVTATADYDGFETTAYLGKSHLSNRYGVAIDAQYITVVCPEVGTRVTLHTIPNDPVIQDCVSTNNFVGKAYFDALQAPISKGSFIESNKPVFVVLESLATDDEKNLLGARNVPSNNVLVIVADDLGMDILQSFDIEGLTASEQASLDRVPTPNIDRLLIKKGVKFTNVMANPVCSPTRASIQTGRYGTRTGVVWATFESNRSELPLAELTIPEVLNQRGYAHAAIGKWHLSNSFNGGNDGPRAAGYGHHSGSFQNIIPVTPIAPALFSEADYYRWEKMVNGVPEIVTNYAPTENVDDALQWLSLQDMNKPWFMWFAFNAPHSPWQVPPVSDDPGPHHALLTGKPGDRASAEDSNAELYRAMVEYMDEEIGRLIDAIPADELAQTTILFIGDNGTPAQATMGDLNPQHAKFTLYQQGVHVPMIVAGAGVSNPGRTSNQLINSTDLFATILELAGIDISSIEPSLITDSISFLPIIQNVPMSNKRKYAFAETSTPNNFNGNSGVTIRDERFKIIRFVDGHEEFYDLQENVLETEDLLPLSNVHPDFDLRESKYNELLSELNKIIGL
ncbi:MAG: sulfatase-like hydrolase/transferase [Methylococcales bacterium]